MARVLPRAALLVLRDRWSRRARQKQHQWILYSLIGKFFPAFRLDRIFDESFAFAAAGVHPD